jgi:site-specific DNA recombinase
MIEPSVKAAVYLRQSMDRTGEGLAVDRQRIDAETLARFRGWQVVRVEVDNDVSAGGRGTDWRAMGGQPGSH